MTGTCGSVRGSLGLALIGLLILVGLWTGWSTAISTWMVGVLNDLIIGFLEQQLAEQQL